MCELFADIPAAIENTVEIAVNGAIWTACFLSLNCRFPDARRHVAWTNWHRSALKGRSAKAPRVFVIQIRRFWKKGVRPMTLTLKYELGTIKGTKFPGYFLIVQDHQLVNTTACQWTRPRVWCGFACRHSPGITDLDPLHFDLLFERFLNPNAFPCLTLTSTFVSTTETERLTTSSEPTVWMP